VSFGSFSHFEQVHSLWQPGMPLLVEDPPTGPNLCMTGLQMIDRGGEDWQTTNFGEDNNKE